MTFLNSIFLGALAAVVIPLLIHFLSRRRIKIVDFSSLKFLFQMQKSKLRWLRILELLLLIIRMMILALIALAFARPTLTGKHASSHAPASVVILLDDSPSVDKLSSGGTVFDDMKRGVEKIVNMFSPNDEITLITLAGKQTISGPHSDFDRFRTQLYSLQAQPAPLSYKEGFKKAADILANSHNLNREVYLFSDFQTGEWENAIYDIIDPQFRYFAIKYNADNTENVGLTRTEFPPQLLAPGEEFEITAFIRNYNNKAVDGKLVELFIDDNKKAQTALDIKPSGTAAAKFIVVPESPGPHWGYFEIEDDDYSPDNRFYFNFEIPHKISVLGVSDNQDDLRILDNCLGRSSAGYIEFTGININSFSRQNLSEYDVIILNNITALPQSYYNSLDDFIASGGGLFIILGNKSNIESYKNFIENKADINISETVQTESDRLTESYFYLENFDLTHPIFKVYSPQNIQQSRIPPLKLLSFSALNGGVPLARLEDNRTVLSLSSKARVMVMGFGLNRKSSDISIHSFIVPFIIRSVEHLASAPSSAEEYFISGHPITINIPGQLNVSSVKLSKYNKSLSDAGNELGETDQTIKVSRGTYGAFINLPFAGYPGFYSLRFFSVNHDSSESTNESVDSDILRKLLSDDIVFINSQFDIENEIMQAKFGFELWKYFLVLALVLLIAESVIVKRAK